MKKYSALFFIWLLSLNLYAQDFEKHLKIGIENNPMLKSKEAFYKASLEKIKQIGLEDPKIDAAIYTPAMPRYIGDHLFDLTLMQMFPWFGALRASRNEAHYMAKMEFEKYEEEKNELVFQIKNLWYDYYKAKKEEELFLSELELFHSLYNLKRAKLKIDSKSNASIPKSASKPSADSMQGNTSSSKMNMGGMGGNSTNEMEDNASSMNDSMGAMGSAAMQNMQVQSAFIELLNLDLQIIELAYRLENKKNASKSILFAFHSLLNNEDKHAEIKLPKEEIKHPKEEFKVEPKNQFENNPMIKMTFWNEKAKEAQIKMAKSMGKPMIGIGLSYMRFRPRRGASSYNENMNMNNMFMPMFSLSLPIYRKKYKGVESEAKLLKESSIYERKNLKNQLASELQKLYFGYKENFNRYKFLSEQIKTTKLLIRLIETSYKVGKTSMEELIRQNQNLLKCRQENLDLIIKQHKIMALIEKMKAY